MQSFVKMLRVSVALGRVGHHDHNIVIMADTVKDLINNNPVVIFSKVTCPYSVKSKRLITGLGYKFKSIELDEREDRTDLEKALKASTDLEGTPFIFIGGKCIGNNKDVQLMAQKEVLVSTLTAANAYEYGKLYTK